MGGDGDKKLSIHDNSLGATLIIDHLNALALALLAQLLGLLGKSNHFNRQYGSVRTSAFSY